MCSALSKVSGIVNNKVIISDTQFLLARYSPFFQLPEATRAKAVFDCQGSTVGLPTFLHCIDLDNVHGK